MQIDGIGLLDLLDRGLYASSSLGKVADQRFLLMPCVHMQVGGPRRRRG